MNAVQLPDELVQGIVLKIGGSWGDATPEDRLFFKRFAALVAALVAAHEREECLKLVDEQIFNMTVLDSYPEQSGAIYQAIINIRARGEK